MKDVCRKCLENHSIKKSLRYTHPINGINDLNRVLQSEIVSSTHKVGPWIWNEYAHEMTTSTVTISTMQKNCFPSVWKCWHSETFSCTTFPHSYYEKPIFSLKLHYPKYCLPRARIRRHVKAKSLIMQEMAWLL